jgi:predicted RNase H-like nuclease
MGKIDEVDALMSPELQRRVVEVHPEVSFATMNNDVALKLSKKTAAGRALRIGLLGQAWGVDVGALVQKHRGKDAKPDDILDAMAACWTAERVLRGEAEWLPPVPPVDSRGLRMAIVR